jgi:hypothetical protein
MTPDWSDTPEPVPYGSFENPQSLNLYSYVQNNPTTLTDPTGHGCDTCEEAWEGLKELVDEGAAEGTEMIRSPGGAGVRIVGGAAGFYLAAMLHPKSVGQSDADEMAEKARLQQEKDQNQGKEGEPQAEAASGGARKGGGRDEKKANPDRVKSAKEKIADLKQQRDTLDRKANKTPADKANLDKLKSQIKRETDRIKKSETHSRKHKGQQ